MSNPARPCPRVNALAGQNGQPIELRSPIRFLYPAHQAALASLLGMGDSPLALRANVGFLSPTGNDGAQPLSDPSKPFATAQAALTAGATVLVPYPKAGDYGGLTATGDLTLTVMGIDGTSIGDIAAAGHNVTIQGNGTACARVGTITAALAGAAANGDAGTAGVDGTPGVDGTAGGNGTAGANGASSGRIILTDLAYAAIQAGGQNGGNGGDAGRGGNGGNGDDRIGDNGQNGGNPGQPGSGGNAGSGGNGGIVTLVRCTGPAPVVTPGIAGVAGHAGASSHGGTGGHGDYGLGFSDGADNSGNVLYGSDGSAASNGMPGAYSIDGVSARVLSADGAGVTYSTTLVGDATLRFPAAANETWTFDGYLFFADGSGTLNFSASLASSSDVAASSVYWFSNLALQCEGLSNFWTLGDVSQTGQPNVIGDVVSCPGYGNGISGGGYVVRVIGSVTMGGAAGVIVLQYAQAQMDSSTLQLKAGSYFIARKMS